MVGGDDGAPGGADAARAGSVVGFVSRDEASGGRACLDVNTRRVMGVMAGWLADDEGMAKGGVSGTE